jgi:hypothetical protein
MGIQIIHNQHDFFRIRIMGFRQFPQAAREIYFGPGFVHPHFAPPGVRLKEHKQAGCSAAFILIAADGWVSRLYWERCFGFSGKLPISLVKAYGRLFFVIRTLIYR